MTLDATDTRYWHNEVYQQLAEDSSLFVLNRRRNPHRKDKAMTGLTS